MPITVSLRTDNENVRHAVARQETRHRDLE